MGPFFETLSKEVDAYNRPKKELPPFLPVEKREEIPDEEPPDELTCRICNDLIQDPRKTPCCQTSYCVDCITNRLLEADESRCPQCKKEHLWKFCSNNIF